MLSASTLAISLLIFGVSHAQSMIAPANPDFLDRDDLVVRFASQGGCIKDLQIKNFKESLGGEENARVTGGRVQCRALAVKIGQEDLRNSPAEISIAGQGSATIVQKSGAIEVSRTLQLREPYTGEFSVMVKNTGSAPWSGPVGVDVGLVSEPKDAGGLFGGPSMEYREAVFYADEKLTRVNLPFDEKTTLSVLEEKSSFKPEWVASNSLYFALALLPKGGELFDVKVIRTGFNSGPTPQLLDRTLYELWVSTIVNDLAPGSSKTINFDFYAGPKSKSALSASFNSKSLSKNIDFGFFSVVAWPLFYVLKWFETISKNWGLAIILLTLVLKIVLYPLTEKAFVAGKKMQKLQPELNALKDKFKDDKQAQQKEM
ncbi:MAG: membrane protein insertase YidC, partial [Silvanigrellaceae bacterium]